jgi:malonyl-CoA/methylmalonyl-CoA synthetase
MASNLFTAFAAASSQRNKIFLFPPGRAPIKFSDVFEQSARFAHVLKAHGVKPGDRVAVQVEKSAEALILYLASLRMGAVFLPLNTGYTASEVSYFITDAAPRVFVCSPKNRDVITDLCDGGEVLTLGDDGQSGSLVAEAKGRPSQFPDADVGMDDLAAILYTSGTTGRSKGAMLSHGNLLSNAQALKEVWQFTDQDVLLHALPIFHTHGLFVATNVSLLAGSTVILLPKFDADEIFNMLPGATCMMGVPTFYVRLVQDARLDEEATRHMRLFISGSAPLLAETHREWSERTGHDVLERYGMTETNMITSNPYVGKRMPGSVGFPLPGTELRIADDTGAPVPQGEIGMIEVRGPNVFSGYWRMPEKTKTEFRSDGFFITGDLGKIDPEGYVHIVGRSKDLVITGGFNVYPKEVETLIDGLPGVEESAVIGLPHDDFGEGVTAIVIPKKGFSPTEPQIIAALDGRLAKFKLPKRVLFAGQFPRNTMGKIQKNLLREQFKDLYKKSGKA